MKPALYLINLNLISGLGLRVIGKYGIWAMLGGPIR
jgi:hypothetical protein